MDTSKLKLRMQTIARKAGREVMVIALTLWFCMIDPNTPKRIKALIFADLAYLISPIDAIPDFLPLLGFSDDMGLLAATLAALAAYVKMEHREQAKAKADEWLA